MNKKENLTRQIIQRAKQLSPEAQQALYLLVQNLDIIDALPCGSMTLKEKTRYAAQALQHRDYLSAMIVEYKWLKQEDEKE